MLEMVDIIYVKMKNLYRGKVLERSFIKLNGYQQSKHTYMRKKVSPIFCLLNSE